MPRSAADILLELLGKVPDAATLELLLEPEHLIQLLRAHGWSEDDIRRDLKEGKRAPGELLLAVLERQPDTSALLAILGNPTPKPPKAAVAQPGSPPRARSPKASPVARLVIGALLAGPAGWYLLVRLDVLHVPGLARYFPQTYAMLAALVVSGVYLVVSGIVGLTRSR